MVSLDFVAGFLSGEASFTVYTREERGTISPRLSVMVHEKDKDTLYALKDFFDAGEVYDRTDFDDCYHWRVSNGDDLQAVVERLDECDTWQVTEKYDQYQTWRRLVELYTKEYHTTTETRIEMAELARDELNVGLGKTQEDWDEFIESLRS